MSTTVEKAREANVRKLAERLHLPHASGQKYACPVCPSSDALHVRDDEAVCYSAKHPGATDGAVMDGIDLVQAARGVGFREAVEWITGERLEGDGRDHSRAGQSQASQSTHSSQQGDEPVDLEPTTAFLERVLRHEDSFLSEAGAAYLQSRGLSRQTAEQVGIVDFTKEEWGAWCAKAPDDDWLRASGLVANRDGEPSLHPYYDHFLAIPYWGPGDWTFAPPGASWREEGELETVRFRTTNPRHEPKMMSVTSEGPSASTVPYLEASVGAAGRYRGPLFVVEGELDALSVWEAAGWPVIATNSAHHWPREWCEGWEAERIPDVVVVAEGDEGGQAFAQLVEKRARQVHGEQWAHRHLHCASIEEGRDLNDLLVAGELRDRIDKVLSQLDEASEGAHPMHGPYGPSRSEWGGRREGQAQSEGVV
ncbi:MAG: hypothetical protein ABEN55_13380 [Bradymonadaceae bacterium]